MGVMHHLVFLIFSLIAFSHIANSHSITELLEKGGLTTFASLINKTRVVEAYEAAMKKKGVTIFAPSDAAFAEPPIMEALKKLTPDQAVTLLKYHAVGNYIEILKKGDPISTLATDDSGNYILKATTNGRVIILIAEENSAQVDSIILDKRPLLIVNIDAVLQPSALFGESPAPAPSDVNFAGFDS